MKKALTLLFVLAGLKMFAQTPEPNFAISAIESSKTWIDLDYVGDGLIGHKLDIFLPKKGKAPFPIIVTIYGSAWFSNSAKGSCFKDGFGQELLNNGFAVVSINHRSSADAVWPAQLHDIKNKVPFLIIHGTNDKLVPYCQSQELYQKMQLKKIPSQFLTVDGGEHGPGVMIDKYYKEIVDFFKIQKNNVKKNKF
ncbi:MAG: prolyl oligopeptidase family serine peptidase [Saprospiraceae bacterium]|nr:prolyl oligopeptidase family serine peptidase [Saprospiraceae bacterium]